MHICVAGAHHSAQAWSLRNRCKHTSSQIAGIIVLDAASHIRRGANGRNAIADGFLICMAEFWGGEPEQSPKEVPALARGAASCVIVSGTTYVCLVQHNIVWTAWIH